MSADVVASPTADRRRADAPALVSLAVREAWRLDTSPAALVLIGYIVLVLGVGSVSDLDEILDRGVLAEFAAAVCILMMGLLSYSAAHLVATSSRRAGAERQLSATPLDPFRRDLALSLAVLLGPALVSLVLALVAAWLAAGVDPVTRVELSIDPWAWTDVVQVPVMVLGAGILGIVVARWLPFPGSFLIGFVGMIAITVWPASSSGSMREWFTWFVVIPWFVDLDTVLVPTAAMAWHAVYLLSWSVLGICVIGVRQAQHRRRWVAAAAGAVALVVVTGFLQVPDQLVRLDL